MNYPNTNAILYNIDRRNEASFSNAAEKLNKIPEVKIGMDALEIIFCGNVFADSSVQAGSIWCGDR